MSDLTQAESHFAFGENWKSFLDTVDEPSLGEAVKGLRSLFPGDELKGASFLDIGSGSGLSSVAAGVLGAGSITAVDIDKNSVAASASLLSQHLKDMPRDKWSVTVRSVFDLSPQTDGQFDVVHSWGVLHHTGDMWRAIDCAAAMVKPGGLFAIALYRKTKYCGFWRAEKRLYANGSKSTQGLLRAVFKPLFVLNIIRRGENPITHIREYKSRRGMDWSHDVHDWLGGYPYKSVLPQEVHSHLEALGFRIEREFVQAEPKGIWRYLQGLSGAVCDEFVARRI